MKQADLEKRRQSLQSAAADTEDDFEEIVVNSNLPDVDKNKITLLPLDCLVEYADESFEEITGRPQPFKLYSEDNLKSLAKSIEENGVINPIIVRPMENGKYQILAGRNRTRASKLCGKLNIPAIIKADISDIEAAVIMLDTNLEQRPNLSYSEKAYAYKMRVDLQKQQGKRTDLLGEAKKDTLSEVGKENKESRRTVAYLIRLTFLIPILIDMVDEGKLGFKIGVALSYLNTETQNLVYSNVLIAGNKIKQSHIKELKVLESCNALTEESLMAVFEKHEKPKPPSYTISSEALRDYTDILTDEKTVENLFIEFLKNYRCSVK